MECSTLGTSSSMFGKIVRHIGGAMLISGMVLTPAANAARISVLDHGNSQVIHTQRSEPTGFVWGDKHAEIEVLPDGTIIVRIIDNAGVVVAKLTVRESVVIDGVLRSLTATWPLSETSVGMIYFNLTGKTTCSAWTVTGGDAYTASRDWKVVPVEIDDGIYGCYPTP